MQSQAAPVETLEILNTSMHLLIDADSLQPQRARLCCSFRAGLVGFQCCRRRGRLVARRRQGLIVQLSVPLPGRKVVSNIDSSVASPRSFELIACSRRHS